MLRLAGTARYLVLVFWVVGAAGPALAQPGSPPPTVLRLATPAGAAGVGSALAGLDDVNGDGIRDVVVGAPGSSHVFVMSGAGGAVVRAIPSPSTGRTFGTAVAATGDVDRDGTGDFAVGAPSDRTLVPGPAAGRVFLFSGASGALLRELAPATADAPDFGRAVSSPGDLSADGVPDVVVGSPGGQGGGSVFAFSAANGAQLWSRPEPSTSFGQLLAPTADVSGDGVADVLVAGAAAAPAGQPAAGAGLVTDLLAGVLNGVLSPVVPERVHVLSGATGAVVRALSDPAPHANDGFGGAVAAVGDQDGDGFVDHLVGERGANQLHLYSGDDGALLRSVPAPATAQPAGAFALAGVDDNDGDGRDDVWVGIGPARSAYLVNGTGAVLATAPAPSPAGSFGAVVAPFTVMAGDPRTGVVVGDPTEVGGGAAYLVGTGPRPSPAAEPLMRTSAQTSTPATTSTTAAVPATATLPKPADSSAELSTGDSAGEAGLASTGGRDRSAAGLSALGLGLAGLLVLGALGTRDEPATSSPGKADG